MIPLRVAAPTGSGPPAQSIRRPVPVQGLPPGKLPDCNMRPRAASCRTLGPLGPLARIPPSSSLSPCGWKVQTEESREEKLDRIGGGGWRGWGGAMPDFKPLETGDEVPAFAALTLDGEEFDGGDLVGAPYMLNIWATWCAPCRHEMPELQELHDTYSEQGFQVVGVSVDDRRFARDDPGVPRRNRGDLSHLPRPVLGDLGHLRSARLARHVPDGCGGAPGAEVVGCVPAHGRGTCRRTCGKLVGSAAPEQP